MDANHGNGLGERALTGSKQILTRCLELVAGSAIAVFYDESTLEVEAVIEEAATQSGVKVIRRFVPRETQFAMSANGELSHEDLAAIWSAQAIVNVPCDDPQGTTFRTKILEY